MKETAVKTSAKDVLVASGLKIAKSAVKTAATKSSILLGADAVAFKPKPKRQSSIKVQTSVVVSDATVVIQTTPSTTVTRPKRSSRATKTIAGGAKVAKSIGKLADHWKTRSVQDLTDDDILAMPEEEYMNEVQLAFFRHKLVKMKSDMLSNAGETTEHLREETVVVPDPTDRATIEEEHALELRTRDRERKLLKKIDQSIANIDAGVYGFCEETGEPIGVKRLLARPTANLSLEAQQRREIKQKMFGE